MEKGVHGLLNHSDDLFDLPEYISTNTINQKVDKHLQNMVNVILYFFNYVNDQNSYF